MCSKWYKSLVSRVAGHSTQVWTRNMERLIFGSQFWSLGSPGSDGHMWSTSGEGPVPL